MARDRKNNGSGNSEGAPEWMTTYSDLVTLLLTFFILLFSMAVIDEQKFEEISYSLKSTLLHTSNGEKYMTNRGQSILTINVVNPDDTGKKKVDNEKYKQVAEEVLIDNELQQQKARMEEAKEQLQAAIEEINEKLGNTEDEPKIELIQGKDFFLIDFPSDLFFKSGSANINEAGKEVLLEVGKTLSELDNEIMVQGHTDNVPIHNSEFDSNWELSAKRAINAAKVLIDSAGVKPSRVTATGNGEFKPKADNDTPEGKQINRRVEIKIFE